MEQNERKENILHSLGRINSFGKPLLEKYSLNTKWERFFTENIQTKKDCYFFFVVVHLKTYIYIYIIMVSTCQGRRISKEFIEK